MLRRLWSHSGFRYTLYTLVGIGLCVLIPKVLLTWIGGQRWQHIQSQLEAEGETLDFFSLYPPSLPNQQNFCAIPLLDGIRTPAGSSPAAVAAEQKREAIDAALVPLQVPRSKSAGLAGWALFPDVLGGETMDQEKVLAEIYQAKTLPLNDDQRSWGAVKMALEAHASIIGEMARAAAERPAAEWLPRQAREALPETLMSLPVPEMTPAQKLSNLLRFHAMVCLLAGDSASAVADVRSMLRLASATERSLLLIGNLISVTIRTQALQVTARILQERRLQEPELTTLQQEWLGADIHGDYLRDVRSEMIAVFDAFDDLQADPRALPALMNMNGGISVPLRGKGILEQALVVPSKAASAEFIRQFYLMPLKTQRFRGFHANMTLARDTLTARSGWMKLEWQLPQLFLLSHSAVGEMAVYTENCRLQVILACALERHYLRHGSYPATLQAVDAEFLAGNDARDVDGNPMRYALTADGRYRLWSPGPDGKDDDGKYHTEIASGATRSRQSPHYRGDWVWRYDPPVKVSETKKAGR